MMTSGVRSRSSFVRWGALLPLLAAGCLASTSPTPSAAQAVQPRPELSCERQGAERIETASYRGGSKPDVLKVFHKNADGNPPLYMSCKEVDLNGDGRKDMLLYLDKYGRKLREEFDHDKDGVADQKSYYEAGVMVRDEHDSDSDGKIDLIEHYQDGKRVRLERVSVPTAQPAPPSAPSNAVPSVDAAKTDAAKTDAAASPSAPSGTTASAPSSTAK